MNNLINLDGGAIATALAEGLESMAFISASPAEPPFVMPENATLVRINFTGPLCGALEMIAGQCLGIQLLCNVAAIEDPSEVTPAQAVDALKEIMNVVCGALLRGARGAAQFEISLPTSIDGLGDAAWAAFTASDGTVVIDVEGSTVAVRLAPFF